MTWDIAKEISAFCIPIVTAIAVIVALWNIYWSNKQAQKNLEKQLATTNRLKKEENELSVLKDYFSIDLILIREQAYKVMTLWRKNKNFVSEPASYFMGGFDGEKAELPDNRDKSVYKTTYYQSLAVLLSFWHRVYLLHKLHKHSDVVIESLDRDFAIWYPLFHDLATKCEASITQERPCPSWVNSIAQLSKVFPSTIKMKNSTVVT